MEDNKEKSLEEKLDILKALFEDETEDRELTEEEREIVMDMLTRSYTIEEAIAEKQEEDKMIEENFDACMYSYDALSNYRKKCISMLYFAKIRLYLTKLLALLLNSESYGIIGDTIEKVNDTRNKFVEQKELLTSIKNSLDKLRKNKTIVCNYELCYLMNLIYNLNDRRMLELNDYMKGSTLAINGIRYYGNKTYNDEIKVLDSEVNKFSMRLGLTKKKELSGSNSDDIK